MAQCSLDGRHCQGSAAQENDSMQIREVQARPAVGRALGIGEACVRGLGLGPDPIEPQVAVG
jgi:hypothetical protein